MSKNVLQPGEALAPGEALTSPNGYYMFIMQGDGNLVLYQNGHPRWASHTEGQPVKTCIMQTDGNLVLYTEQNPVFATHTEGHDGAYLILQDDGNVVIYRDLQPLWATNTVDSSSAMKRLLEKSCEYGWSHSGHDSWGGDWHKNACNEALEQIRTKIASMVNLKELETFTHSDLKSSLNAELTSDSIKIGGSNDKSEEEKLRWVNQNNYLIDVSNVRVKPGTDWSDGEQDWQGRRTWKASATMLYDLVIFGVGR